MRKKTAKKKKKSRRHKTIAKKAIVPNLYRSGHGHDSRVPGSTIRQNRRHLRRNAKSQKKKNLFQKLQGKQNAKPINETTGKKRILSDKFLFSNRDVQTVPLRRNFISKQHHAPNITKKKTGKGYIGMR